ncbi:hypothetical protein ACFX2I_020696 [Malus domestica]
MAPVGIRVLELTALPAFFLTEVVIIFAMGMSMASGYRCGCVMWLMGFLSFWHRGEVRAVRVRVLPWHVFIGLYMYGLAVATVETGLLEKLTFLQIKRNVSKQFF